MTAEAIDLPGWTCPFCALLCEGFAGPVQGAAHCARARERLEALSVHAGTQPADADARVSQAIAEAASRLATWRQPLFAGMGTDVSGARALFRLAARTGAICDHADGGALMHGQRAVQDRGQYIATIGELHARAHTLVFFGTDAVTRYPRFFDRLGLERADSPCRKLVFVGAATPSLQTRAEVVHLPGSGDLFADVQQLAAWVARKPTARPSHVDAAMTALADELLASPYAVLVWEGGALPAHGALIVEMLDRVVGTLNQTTRAATFGLGGNDGAASVNQAFTWLSGLPLRTRVAHDGLTHDPHRFGTARALADGAVDGVLWVHSFDATRVPPPTTLPRIVLGPPAMASRLDANDVFIPVAVPGLHAGAHLFRTDGPVLLKLDAAEVRLMTVAQIAEMLMFVLDEREISFKLRAYDDGTHYLAFQPPKLPAFEASGLAGDGHDWERLLCEALPSLAPEALAGTEFDCESDMFIARNREQQPLQRIQAAITRLLADEVALRGFIARIGDAEADT